MERNVNGVHLYPNGTRTLHENIWNDGGLISNRNCIIWTSVIGIYKGIVVLVSLAMVPLLWQRK